MSYETLIGRFKKIKANNWFENPRQTLQERIEAVEIAFRVGTIQFTKNGRIKEETMVAIEDAIVESLYMCGDEKQAKEYAVMYRDLPKQAAPKSQ